MANKNADNAVTMVNTFYWLNIGGDTPVVWKYTCSNGNHRVIATKQLVVSTNAGADGKAVCPHDSGTLSSEAAVSVA